MYDGRKIFLLPYPKFHGNDFSQERQIGKTMSREQCYRRSTPAIFQSLYGSVRVDLPLLKRGMFWICDVVT
jgi:hypothetical protein